jgi:hypothetical protein
LTKEKKSFYNTQENEKEEEEKREKIIARMFIDKIFVLMKTKETERRQDILPQRHAA